MGWGLRINNFSIMGAHRKFLGGGRGGWFTKKTIKRGWLPRKAGLEQTVCRFKMGLGKKRGDGIFEVGGGGGGGRSPNAHHGRFNHYH